MSILEWIEGPVLQEHNTSFPQALDRAVADAVIRKEVENACGPLETIYYLWVGNRSELQQKPFRNGSDDCLA